MAEERRVQATGWPELTGPTTRHPAGSVLFRAGEDVNTLYVIEGGTVALREADVAAGPVSRVRGPGGVLGVAPLMTRRPHSFTAAALTACDVRLVRPAAFLEACEVHPGLAARVRAVLAAVEAEPPLLVGSAEERCERLIVALFRASRVELPDGAWRIDAEVGPSLLADMVGSSRATTSPLFSRWKREGALHERKGWLLMPRGSRLRHRVAPDGS